MTPVRSDASYPLTDADAALSYWQALPKDDAIAAQSAICKVLAEQVPRGIPSTHRLQALLVLDQRARALVDSLLTNEGGARPSAKTTASRSWQGAFELCRSFGRAYGMLVRSIRDNGEFENRRDLQSLVLLRFFRQRQLELLLRPFTDERAPAFAWKEIHDAYVLAQSRWLHREPIPVKREQSSATVEVRLEREYVVVLMQELLSSGQFPPHEASWINRHLPRWCLAMTLVRDESPAGANRFVVDPGSDVGLVRSNGEPVETWLRLDMTPVLKSLSAQIASLRDATERPPQGSTLRRARQLKVLQKVNALCSAERPVITRRGERKPTAVTVEVAVGLVEVLRRVRNRPEDVIAAVPIPSPRTSEGVTIGAFGDTTGQGAYSVMQSSTGAPLLTMVDQSDSGCRLQGAALISNPALPGALIAFREDATLPWSLAVVRRAKKRLAGRRIEIGAEYLGTGPRWVVIVVDDSAATPGNPAEREAPRFAGLYLPESDQHPLLPIKTLVLPTCGLSPGDRLSVRSRRSVYTVRLKEPLEEQSDFIWSPFEILDRWVKDEPASDQAAESR
ncbi:MAG TPA: hypothetical protein VMU96_12415 [Casimicrobiaceae bacterium]|nr:hypothetical protein [Casimicrobiaceae bacterium]